MIFIIVGRGIVAGWTAILLLSTPPPLPSIDMLNPPIPALTVLAISSFPALRSLSESDTFSPCIFSREKIQFDRTESIKSEEVTPEASFVDDLGADSLDTVELVMALEEEFGVEIPDEDAEKIATVGDAIKYIEEKSANK